MAVSRLFEVDTDALIDRLVEEWFQRIRGDGFLDRSKLDGYRQRAFQQLCNVDFDKLIVFDEKVGHKVIKSSSTGQTFLWSYFPHRYEIRCNKLKAPIELVRDDERLRKKIRRAITKIAPKTLIDTPSVSDSFFRGMLAWAGGYQLVNNFRPTAAAALYRYFMKMIGRDCGSSLNTGLMTGMIKKPETVVWDMSMGFGGRMCGAITSRVVGKYIGTDPSTKTFAGLEELKRDFGSRGTEIEMHCCGAEDLELPENSVDVCFTSPPYFDCEKYADEGTQSWVKFTTQDAWLNGFLGKVLDNCIHCLKPDGVISINIAPIQSYPNVCVDMLKMADAKGLVLVEELKLALKSIVGQAKRWGVFKSEPVYVFRLK